MSQQTIRIYKIFLLFGILVLSGIFHVWVRTKVVTAGYQVAQTRNEIAEMESKISHAKLKRSRYMSAENLEKVSARMNQMGIYFLDPTQEQLIYVREESDLLPAEKAQQ